MRNLLTDGLTVLNEADGRRQAHTHPGMASWADHASGKACSSCRYFQAAKGKATGKCWKYSQLMRGAEGASFPANSFACKYWEGKDGV